MNLEELRNKLVEMAKECKDGVELFSDLDLEAVASFLAGMAFALWNVVGMLDQVKEEAEGK